MSHSSDKLGILERYLDQLYNLGVGVIGQGSERHERPHKPVMLLAVLDLMDAGKIRENRICWSDELRDQFSQIFEKVRAANDKPTPENPFFYLRSEKFWRHVAEPAHKDLVAGLSNPPRLGDLATGLFHVELEPRLFTLLTDPVKREVVRDALISRYFPDKRTMLIRPGDTCRLQEEPAVPSRGRDAAFRHLILETYDYQCVACGIRLRLPNDVTIVDAAHLIPFSESRNDHPTNGFALCKNHHWAFDRHLITPTPEGFWRVSNRLEARRSKGESELVGLEGERLLPPRDEAYAPSTEAVQWRMERLWN